VGSLGSAQNQGNQLGSFQQPKEHFRTMHMNPNVNRELIGRYREHNENIPDYNDQVLNYKVARAGNQRDMADN